MRIKAANRRIVVLAAAFALLLAVAFGRAFWLQAVKATPTRRWRCANIARPWSSPRRGSIFDRNGEPLAIGEPATTVFANPRQVDQPAAVTLATVKRWTPSRGRRYPALTDRSHGFVYIARKAIRSKAEELEKLGFAGIGFYPEELRTYPQGPVAAQVLGFAGLDNVGLEGLERSLEKLLAGQPGSQTIVKDPIGRALDVVATKPETPGRGVRLTIDHQIQANAEVVLQDTVRRYGAGPRRRSSWTRTRVPCSRWPPRRASSEPLRDDAPRTPSEPRRHGHVRAGSTFKLVTVAAALQEGMVTPRTSFRLAPTIKVADRVIRESHTRGTERLTVRQVVEYSSNIGTITIAQRLGSVGSRPGSTALGSGADRHRLPGRIAGLRAPARTLVRAPRSGTSRSGTASR